MKDLYKTLGVAENADEAAIKKAYRKLAKEFHPDVTGGDKKKTERFKEINEAYDVLGDDQEAHGVRPPQARAGPADGMPEGFDADAFAQTFGALARRRGRRRASIAGDFESATSSPACSAAAGPARLRSAARRRARPGARQRRARTPGGDASRGRARRQANGAHRQRRDRRGADPARRRERRPPAPPRPGRARAGAAAARPAISTSTSRSARIRTCGATAPTSSSTCR